MHSCSQRCFHRLAFALHSRNLYQKAFVAVLLNTPAVSFFSSSAFAGNKLTIYFYNPEININNFASLKKEFDTYLSAYGEYQLQPFSEREIFEKVAVSKNDGIFIISGWHYKN